MTSADTVVQIEWVDSLEKHGWMSAHDALDEDPCTVKSIGFLLREPLAADPYWILARDVAAAQDLTCGVMRIPDCSVIDVFRVDTNKMRRYASKNGRKKRRSGSSG